MNPKLQQRIKNIAFGLKDVPRGRNKHFSFIIYQNRIVSTGWNDYWATHTECYKYGYQFCSIHSEMAAILHYRGNKDLLNRCILVNVRVGADNNFTISKPCEACQKMISGYHFKRVYYTDHSGNFTRFFSNGQTTKRATAA